MGLKSGLVAARPILGKSVIQINSKKVGRETPENQLHKVHKSQPVGSLLFV